VIGARAFAAPALAATALAACVLGGLTARALPGTAEPPAVRGSEVPAAQAGRSGPAIDAAGAAARAAQTAPTGAPAAGAAVADPAAAPDPPSRPTGAGNGSPSGPLLTVTVAPGRYTVGDRVEAVLTLSAQADGLTGEPRFPDWGAAWGDAEVISAGAVERVEPSASDDSGPANEPGEVPRDRTLFRQRLELAAFRTGEVPLPPVALTVPTAGGELLIRTSEGLALAIDSVLPPAGEDGVEPEPLPPAPPLPLPLGTRFWWTLAAAVAACGLALLWALMRRRRAAATAAAPLQPPFEELRAALAAARREESPAAGHAAVSLAFRRYLGGVLHFPAAESSTAEIRREVSGRRLPEGAARRVVALLAGCDLIKFARREATAGQLAERADGALGLAAEIEAHLRPAPVESAGAAGPASPREEAA